AVPPQQPPLTRNASASPSGTLRRTRASNRTARGVSPTRGVISRAAGERPRGAGSSRSPTPPPPDAFSGARPTALGPAAGLSRQLLLQRPDDEIHHRDVRLHAVEFELTMKLLRNACRELDPNFPLTCHNAPFAGHGGNSRLCIYRAWLRAAIPLVTKFPAYVVVLVYRGAFKHPKSTAPYGPHRPRAARRWQMPSRAGFLYQDWAPGLHAGGPRGCGDRNFPCQCRVGIGPDTGCEWAGTMRRVYTRARRRACDSQSLCSGGPCCSARQRSVTPPR